MQPLHQRIDVAEDIVDRLGGDGAFDPMLAQICDGIGEFFAAAENDVLAIFRRGLRQQRAAEFRKLLQHLIGASADGGAQQIGVSRQLTGGDARGQALGRGERRLAPVRFQAAASWAWLFRMTPSSSVFRSLALSVAPVVVMSTMASASPPAGAPSVAPRLSTMR